MRHELHGKKQTEIKHYLTNILTLPLVSVHDCVCDNSQQEFIQQTTKTTNYIDTFRGVSRRCFFMAHFFISYIMLNLSVFLIKPFCIPAEHLEYSAHVSCDHSVILLHLF